VRRVPLTVIGAALVAASAMAASGAAAAGPPPPSVSLSLIPAEARHVQTFPDQPSRWVPGRTMAYWGRFTSQNTPPGSYRATCTWPANKHWPHSVRHKQDKRLSCRIVIAFKAPPAPAGNAPPALNGLILQGLERRPLIDGELFSRGPARQLAISGGSGAYGGAHGVASIAFPWRIVFPNGVPTM
jgi:hypothetical protein